MIFNRQTGEFEEEKIYSSKSMDFLYNTFMGGVCVSVLKIPVISSVAGVIQKSKLSRKRIEKFCRDFKVETNEHYKTFNEFIVRKEERSFNPEKSAFISPADSCLKVYPINNGTLFSIKKKKFVISKLLKSKKLAKEYENGLCLVFRLRVYDFHRFCFVDNGFIKKKRTINGMLESVNYETTKKFVLCSNKRKYSVLQTENFGEIVFMEVGAMLVGRIVNTFKKKDKVFQKGDEKGYFEFGGSTIVILLKENAVNIDKDILLNSENNIETFVRYGEKIGEKV